MSQPSEPKAARPRPSSHTRLSSTGTLYLRLLSAETIVLRRLKQMQAVEAKLVELGTPLPARADIKATAHPELPKQFAAKAREKRERSSGIVREAIALLKRTTCKSRSPGKREIASISTDERVDPEGKGVSINVFRTNQDCLDLYIEACLPKQAEQRKKVATPSWAVRMDHDALIELVLVTEDNRDQLTRDLMAANELVIAPEVARIRKEVVRIKAQRLLDQTA